MRFRVSVYFDVNVDEDGFSWSSIEDVREVVTVIAEDTVKEISENCNTGGYNFYLGGVAYLPIGAIMADEKMERL